MIFACSRPNALVDLCTRIGGRNFARVCESTPTQLETAASDCRQRNPQQWKLQKKNMSHHHHLATSPLFKASSLPLLFVAFLFLFVFLWPSPPWVINVIINVDWTLSPPFSLVICIRRVDRARAKSAGELVTYLSDYSS